MTPSVARERRPITRRENTLLAQDSRFNFAGNSSSRDDGDFQDVVADHDKVRDLFRCIRRTRMTV